ncbi:MAG: FAD-dependent oxidoreductase [Clostridia bacterium]|nr:FAD-dependent oxidoreductase [Clostridia bacterium]
MLKTLQYKADFCVVGGGLAGMCAAIAAARHGAKVVLMQERPVLGGNASGEIRMWVCGASGSNVRETGILEELAMENLWRNPYKIYPIWDSVLWDAVKREENITLLLNCSCMDAEMDAENHIAAVTGWQMTTQAFCRVEAKLFADCSGDSILAPLTGAHYRWGREAASEFGEDVSVTVEDRKTMGMSCLIQAHKGTDPVTFTPPAFAKKLTEDDVKFRRPHMNNSGENFWYLELGGFGDSIADTEIVRDELVALAYGMWDYVKNSGNYEDADYWQLDFLGFLPGKRESRRMMGKYLMTQNDITSDRHFEDVVAFGGWPLDDHDPAGFYYDGHPNTSYQTPSPYAIPYRVLYSENIENLYFAGRNISMTHAAMSSSRVMATCALCGQAAGTAASIAVKYNATPHGVYTDHLTELQDTLLWDDMLLPHHQRTPAALTKGAQLTVNGAEIAEAEVLRDGNDRENLFVCAPGDVVEYRFDAPVIAEEVRIIFDSDLDRVTLPGDHVERNHTMRANLLPTAPIMHLPTTLCKSYTVEAVCEDGSVIRLAEETNNLRRLVIIPVGTSVSTIRFVGQDVHEGGGEIRLFSFEVK